MGLESLTALPKLNGPGLVLICSTGKILEMYDGEKFQEWCTRQVLNKVHLPSLSLCGRLGNMRTGRTCCPCLQVQGLTYESLLFFWPYIEGGSIWAWQLYAQPPLDLVQPPGFQTPWFSTFITALHSS